jgi:uncharacterized membrane protein
VSLRLALYELAGRHHLDRRKLVRLEELAGLHGESPTLMRRLPAGIAVLAAALCGLGLIFWIAANWQTLGRFGRFALLEGCLVAACLGALWRPVARVPFGLLALLAMGAVFAYFGQTYQTGADPWQLFALWAALAVPLCLGVGSDALWAPWSLLAMTAVSLWVQAHTGHRWRAGPEDLPVHLLGWLAALALVVALSGVLRRHTRAGLWALRTALTLAVVMISSAGLANLFETHVGLQYGLALVALALVAGLVASPKAFDVYGLSAVALGLNTLLVAGLGRALLEDQHGREPILKLLLLGIVAAGMLAGSVMCVLSLARRAAVEKGPA